MTSCDYYCGVGYTGVPCYLLGFCSRVMVDYLFEDFYPVFLRPADQRHLQHNKNDHYNK